MLRSLFPSMLSSSPQVDKIQNDKELMISEEKGRPLSYEENLSSSDSDDKNEEDYFINHHVTYEPLIRKTVFRNTTFTFE